MNYLSHYLRDARPGKPYYNFGLALPDFAGASQRGWRADGTALTADAGAIHDIWEGYKAHIAADASFHSSDFFKTNTLALRHLYERYRMQLPGIRLFFVAHIFLEMMLDRLILKSIPETADRFYSDLADINADKVNLFLQQTSTTQLPRFFEFFDQFRNGRYLYTYTEDERLFYALNRILRRAGQNNYPDSLLSVFSELTAEAEASLLPAYQQYFSLEEK